MENKMNSKSTRRRKQNGSSLLEFGLGSVLMIPLLFGTADFGRLFYTSIEVENAAAAGATYGSRLSANMTDTTGISAAAKAEAPEFPTLSVTSSAVCQDNGANTVSCTTPGAYEYVKVTASYTFNTLFSYPAIPSSVPLNKIVMMRGK